ncbi:hypothetical protein TELCIR_08527 [Teladorsagia circumcincta]|uniref:Uncharacterized protein n=1 Tax=Teladorsagia circumcincta TaxID=45464 RepID=A0A2G9UHC5_TELCI|nr:hypothetical protein TELCIR_08527 [Teladorsagia circumcincta]
MMNSPADTVEFYAAKRSDEDEANANEKDLKVFSEAKHKHSVSYTQDGRRMIDGKIEGGSGTAMNLWGETLRRGAITTHMIANDNENENQDNTASEDEAEKDCTEAAEILSPVEVYATNKRLRDGLSEENLKAFTEVKQRQTVTYTKGQYTLARQIRRMSL